MNNRHQIHLLHRSRRSDPNEEEPRMICTCGAAFALQVEKRNSRPFFFCFLFWSWEFSVGLVFALVCIEKNELKQYKMGEKYVPWSVSLIESGEKFLLRFQSVLACCSMKTLLLLCFLVLVLGAPIELNISLATVTPGVLQYYTTVKIGNSEIKLIIVWPLAQAFWF